MNDNEQIETVSDSIPKVFISYSWTGKARAKRLADYLRAECGVEVVIDIYHLKPGQNKFAFMQRIVDDPSIDRVLILCDRAYRDKANNFEGGVGDEATIISPKIYKDANQTKFIPIVMEADEQGNPYLPTFVDGRIYFDISNPQNEQAELKRIVRELYNMPADRAPPLGSKPRWLDFPSVDTTALEDRVNVMTRLASSKADAGSVLLSATSDLIEAVNRLAGLSNSGCDLPGMISQTEPIRNAFIDLVSAYLRQDKPSGEQIACVFERLNNGISARDDLNSDFSHELDETERFLIWDMFLSVTATIVHYERFETLKELLDRTFFVRKMLGTHNDVEPVGYPYFRPYLQKLEDVYRNEIQEQRPITLAGRILTNRHYPPYVTKESLVNADMILSHMSVLFAPQDDPWYPMLAPYARCSGRSIMWSKTVSRSFCKKLFPLFEDRGINEFRLTMTNMDKAWKATQLSQSDGAFGGIASVSHIVQLDAIGSLP